MRNRFKKLCIRTGWLAGAGLFYLLICNLAGRPLIPCMFHQITGLYCPGCGVSRMCLALFRLDFVSASGQCRHLSAAAGRTGNCHSDSRALCKDRKRPADAVSDLDPGRHDRHSAPVRHPAQSTRFYLDAANAMKPTADSYCSHHAKSGVL